MSELIDNQCQRGSNTDGDDLRKKVIETLDRAVDIGFNFERWTFTELAADLISNDRDFQDSSVDQLKPLIKEWYFNAPVLFRMYDE